MMSRWRVRRALRRVTAELTYDESAQLLQTGNRIRQTRRSIEFTDPCLAMLLFDAELEIDDRVYSS